MHVGLITPRYPPNHSGGGGVSAQLLAKMLARNEDVDRVTVYTFDGEGPSKNDGVRIKRYNSPSLSSFEIVNTYAYFKLKDTLSAENVDLLHSYNMQLHPVVGHLSKKLDIPAVATLNSYAFIPYGRINIPVRNLLELYKKLSWYTTGPILRDRIREIDSFIAISSTVVEIYRDTMLENREIEVIPNMCEPELFDSVNESSITRLNEGEPTILYVGSLRATKGVNYLVRAASHLPDDHQIVIAGGGDNKSKYEELSRELEIDDQVTFLGRVPHEDVKKLYTEADLFVHPGIWPEPFGRTILEAMQFELPVVATNIGGPAEVIPQEECLCTPEDPSSLANAITMAMSQKEKIGAENGKHVRDTYSTDIVLPQILAEYHKLVDSGLGS